MFRLFLLLPLFVFSLLITNCNGDNIEAGEIDSSFGQPIGDDPGIADDIPKPETDEGETRPACVESLYIDLLQPPMVQSNCKKANQTQLDQVNAGNAKRDQFLAQCFSETNGSCWCDQVARPNPNSFDTFECTYGQGQVHQLIHPDESTWKNAIEAVKIVEELESINLLTQVIYNWWRPEPYNKNVGGSASRHPFGTSVDIRLSTKAMQDSAFKKLCEMQSAGRIRAIGYYPSTAIHIGVGDHTANTWGKACP